MPKANLKFPISPPRRGLVRNIPPHEIPPDAVADGKNMFLDENGIYRPRVGYSAMASSGPGSRIMGGISFRDLGNEEQVIVATQTHWYRFNFGSIAWTDITNVANTGSVYIQPRFVAFAQSNAMWAIGCNGVDATHRYDITTPAASYVDIAGAPIALDLAIIARRIVYVNTTESGNTYPTRIRWSDADDATSYTANAYLDLSINSGDPIVAIKPLSRTTAIIYRLTDSWLLQAVPGSDTTAFRPERIVGMQGPMTPYSIVEVLGQHYFIGVDRNAYRFNGSSFPVEISESIRPVLRTLDVDYRSYVHGSYLPDRHQIKWWFVKEGDSFPMTAIVYDVFRGLWEVEEEYSEGITASFLSGDPVGWTWDSVQGTWDAPDAGLTTWDTPNQKGRIQIIGTNAGQVHRVDSGTDDNGESFNVSWSTRIIENNPDTVMKLEELEDYFSQASSVQGITRTIYGYDQPAGSPVEITHDVARLDIKKRYRLPRPLDEDSDVFYRFIRVVYSAVISDNSLLNWHGGILFAHDQEDSQAEVAE